ncbi:MAG: diguanylate cyclase [Gammaproteobacteria bacterium]|nr:diguanylate cyclase [Gammaproteobacteria bacterium]MBQ0838389.1 diguanylate cyclase [Gammaproteobacteria bacterium]
MAIAERKRDKKLEKIAALRRSYIEQLPGKLALLKEQWQDCLSGLSVDKTAEAFRGLKNRVHQLAGSGGTFGYAALSDEARALESVLATLDDVRQFTTTDRQIISALLENIATVVDSGLPDSSELATEFVLPLRVPPPGQTVYIVEDDLALGAEIEEHLLRYGYDVTVFNDANSAEQALSEYCPAAMIVDLNLPEGELAGTRLAKAYHSTLQDKKPLIFISARDDWTARLAAARAGGQVYLTKPLDFSELLDSLDTVGLWWDDLPYRVVIMDDEVLLAQNYAVILQAVGMEVVLVEDASSLINLVSEFQPDLILMDVNMPECSGLEAAAVIRQKVEWISIPIVFLSTENSISRQMEALQLGGDDFLKKPISAQHLSAVVTMRIRRFRKLRSRMQLDTLSGLLNHVTLKTRLQTELGRSLRQDTNLTFAMIDLDNFKTINDRFGHLAGDEVIKNVSRLLSQRLRKSDIVGRYGGEEFAVILPDTSIAAARELMEALREQFSLINHRCKSGQFACTFSVGLADLSSCKSGNALVDAADTALYRAKDRGRNCVETSHCGSE